MKKVFLAALLALVGCKSITLDTSMTALQAGDYTLVISACEAGLGVGMDICRVTEGDTIYSSWKMVLPISGSVTGEVDVYYRDLHKTYAIGRSILEIPWRDFFGQDKWTSDLDGEALALAIVRWVDSAGIVRETKYRGIAKIVVTKPGYERMPMDSGQHQWQTTCRIQYSTSGRSALKCQ